MRIKQSANLLARKLGFAWAVPVAVLLWRLLRTGLHRSSKRPADGQESTAASESQEEEPIEDVLLPPTDQIWEMYDEDAVEGLHGASDDPLLMAHLMRE